MDLDLKHRSKKDRKKAKQKQKRRELYIQRSTQLDENTPSNHDEVPIDSGPNVELEAWLAREQKFQLELKQRREWEERVHRRDQQRAEAQKEWNSQARAQEKIDQKHRNCPFFVKTGSCLYGENCSKFHPYPEVSNTILFRNMYAGLGMIAGDEDEEAELQYDEDEILDHFEEFWDDILPEFEAFGEILQLRVCRNASQHLRGNVYVSFKNEEAARKAVLLNGRFYAGKQLTAEFCIIEDWQSAICGQFSRSQCAFGPKCNYLHVFRNPLGKYEGRVEERRGRASRIDLRTDKRIDRRTEHWQPEERREGQKDEDRRIQDWNGRGDRRDRGIEQWREKDSGRDRDTLKRRTNFDEEDANPKRQRTT